MRHPTTTAGRRHHRRPPPAVPTFLTVLTTALALAACDSPSPSDDAPASARERPSASRSTPAPAVSAADGADIRACADANCEVAVARPVTVRFQGPGGPVTLSVTEVGRDEVEYTLKSGNGRAEGGASGAGQGCVTALRENGSGTSCGAVSGTRPSAQPGAVVIQASTGPDGTALLHVVSP
ncbi:MULTISPECIES: hypothetical protein [Streptomyces]|uniref:hypothetical protein n=1 Tax=Streptomyces TaxID=1883 RepID=UPI001B383CE6|nr:hypothetical protein [Streptomyces sp. RT42]MBQ0880092.1 hypothetical protein [Streptomyces sp. RT42]